MNQSSKKFLLGLVLGSLIAIVVLQRCNREAAPSESLTEQLLQDSIRHFKNKNGELVAQNITLQSGQKELLAAVDHGDRLVATVRAQGRKLKDATVVATNAELTVPFDMFFEVPDTVRDTFILFADSWAEVGLRPGGVTTPSGNTTAESPEAELSISLTDILTFWHEYTRPGPFQRKALNIYAKNANPHIRIEGLKSYRVPAPPPKRLGLGLLTGYGINAKLQPGPMLGGGLYYRLW